MTGAELEAVLGELEVAIAAVEGLDEPVRGQVFTLLDGVDALHRAALADLGDAVGPGLLAAAGEARPAVAWLLEAYGVGVDQRSAVEVALDRVRPYVHGHGGAVEVLDVAGGVVRLRLSGACEGCTASAQTLQDGILEALQEGFPAFVRLEVEPDDAPPHPPPAGPVLHQIASLSPEPGPSVRGQRADQPAAR